MFKKISLRWRLTLMTAFLIALCCIGLTIVLNLSANRMVDTIDAAAITTPAQRVDSMPTMDQEMVPLIPAISSEELQQAKHGYHLKSILYTLIAVLAGSALTYSVAGRALSPVRALNEQVKNIQVNNLSESLDVPPAKDEIAELTRSFNEMTDKLDEAFLTQQRFSASAAHELRTPLAVLQTKVDVFRKRERHSAEDYEALISTVEKQTARLRGLVSNLLDMTNLEDHAERQALPLRELLTDILDELSPLARKNRIALSITSDGSAAWGNPSLLHRAFYNLVENAIKYNRTDGKVTVSIHGGPQSVTVRVLDTGIGIPNGRKPHVFEPFFRVDKSRSREMGGAGLGLSLVDSILKLHGGTAAVSDNEQGGSLFTVTLPAARRSV